jgi:hypothetical protein
MDRGQRAELVVAGGIGYVTVTLTGLNHSRGHELLVPGQRLNQSVQGNDFWQTDFDPQRKTWSITFRGTNSDRAISIPVV